MNLHQDLSQLTRVRHGSGQIAIRCWRASQNHSVLSEKKNKKKTSEVKVPSHDSDRSLCKFKDGSLTDLECQDWVPRL